MESDDDGHVSKGEKYTQTKVGRTENTASCIMLNRAINLGNEKIKEMIYTSKIQNLNTKLFVTLC